MIHKSLGWETARSSGKSMTFGKKSRALNLRFTTYALCAIVSKLAL